MGLVQYDESKSAGGEKERRCNSLHDVLSVDSIRHECHRARVAMLVNCSSNAWRLDNDIVNDTFQCINIAGQIIEAYDLFTYPHKPRSTRIG